MSNQNNYNLEQSKEKQQGEVGYYLRYLIGKQILKKYTQKMISSIRSRMFKQMTQPQFIILNDQSHYIDGADQKIYFPWMRSRRKILKKKMFFIQNLLQSLFSFPLFSQENKIIFFINVIDIVLFFILGFYFSTMMCFNSTEQMPEFIYNMISVYIYVELFLILVQLNTGVFKQGKYISSRKIILNQCLHSFTFYSRATIATVFTIIRITNSQHILFIFIIFGHCFTIFNFITQLQERIIEFQFLKKIVSMLVLLYYALFIAHLSSLVWIILGVYETQNHDKSWITQFLKIDESNVDQNKFEIYIASIHYIIVTMVTVGYGDISPTSSSERALNILIMITSSFVFAYIVNIVGQILSEIHNSKKEQERKKQIINSYMKKKNVSLELQQQILQYLYYYWKESKNSKCAEEQQIIEELSDELKQTLLIEANKLVVQESGILNQNFSEALLQKTVQYIQEIKLCPQQNIFQKGDKDNSAIYFIEEGTIEKYMILSEGISQTIKGVHVVQTIEKGMYFGGIEFFTGQKRQFNVRSKDFSTLLCIQRQDFINLLKDFNDDYERFCEIKDTLLYTKGENDMLIKCPSCQQQNHQVDQCPFLHFIPDNEKIISKNQYNYIEINRVKLKRKFTKYDIKNTFSNIQSIQTEQRIFVKKEPELLYLYQIEYLMLEEEEDDDDEDENDNENDNIKNKQQNFEEQVTGQNLMSAKKQNSMLMSIQSIDNRQSQFQDFERLRQTRELSSFIQTNQIKLGHSYSGQFFENIQEDSIGKIKKSTFVNSTNSSALTQAQEQAISNVTQGPVYNAKTPAPQNQMQFDFTQTNDNQVGRQSLQSITEMPSNITQNETPQYQKEKRRSSIFTLNQMLNANQQTLNSYQNNVPLSIYSPYQKKNITDLARKRNSISTTFENINQLRNIRTPNKKSTNKTLFLQVEEQIKNLQEQFIQSQFQQKILLNDDHHLPFETLKSFQYYKVYCNIDEVLKRFKKAQILKISKCYTNNFKMSQLAQLKEDDVELKKIINQKMKQIRTINPKQNKKQKYQQSSELDSFNQIETSKKKQLFSDFICQLNSSSLAIDYSGNNFTGIKKSEETKFHGSPEIIEKDSEEKYQQDDPILDSQKSSIYDLKYLPQFNNFETKHNQSKQYKEIDINETYRIDLLN